MVPDPQTPGPGQESVWDYPRPPRIEPARALIRVVFNDVTVAATDRALRVLETSHPPTYYIPRGDVRVEYLQQEQERTTVCEWKGRAAYFTVEVDEHRTEHAAWHYPEPTTRYAALKDYIAFYAGKMDACFVDDEQARPQPGGFYGGWITSDLAGPFKGSPGTIGW